MSDLFDILGINLNKTNLVAQYQVSFGDPSTNQFWLNLIPIIFPDHKMRNDFTVLFYHYMNKLA